VAFTCSEPFIESVVQEVAAVGANRLLALPLYPQYSLSTSKSALDRFGRAVRRWIPSADYDEIASYPDEPGFLDAHADLIRTELAKMKPADETGPHLLFSAHSIPERFVSRYGDPYPVEVRQSVEGILNKLAWKGPWSLAWQSKLGPLKWIGPSVKNEIERLGHVGVKRILIHPVSFVTDHVETLYEIDILLAETARKAGILEFRRTPALNDHPLFIRSLADLVRRHPSFMEKKVHG
jgi:ferrochelatase